MVGAGISTAAGIPDFRSPKTGLYHNLAKYNLPNPEAIFSIDFFKHNPKPFYTLAKELYPGNFIPSYAHYFIRLLYEKGLLRKCYTQNIDTLEHIAGLPSEALVEAHGSFRSASCIRCGKGYTSEYVKDIIFKDEIPLCQNPKCNGLVKPDIVFFGENLPKKFWMLKDSDFKKCPLLIIIGTSLAVQPFASLVDSVDSKCHRLLINREAVGPFETYDNRNMMMLGDIQMMVHKLVDLLGWQGDIEELYNKN